MAWTVYLLVSFAFAIDAVESGYSVSSTAEEDPKSWIMPALLGIAFIIFVCSSLYINLKKISMVTY